MSKAIRSLLCAILCLIMLLSMNMFSTNAVSAETSVQPRFSYTNFTFTGLDISTNGVATCHSEVEGYDGITTKIHIEMKLQKYTVLWWSNVETWEGTFNDMEAFLIKTETVGSGRYRVKAIYTVYSGSASEEITAFSQEKKITVS